MASSEKPIYWRGWSEKQLAAYQQDQGSSNHCAKYAAASLLNMLFGLVLKGEDLIQWVDSRPLKGTGRFTIFGNNFGSLVYQSANLIRELGRQVGLPFQIKVQSLDKPELLEILLDTKKLALLSVTYWQGEEPTIARGTNSSSSLGPAAWIGGHIMIPAAYDPSHQDQEGQNRPWGFLSSWRSEEEIYWMSDEDFGSSWGRLSLWNTVHITRTGR